jgi:hypothetical protein
MKGPIVRLAANVATVLFVVVIILQLLLALGILPITMAWGGQQTELTPTWRVSSLVAMVILAFFAYIIRRRAGLIGHQPAGTSIKILSWLVTVYLLFNTVLNLASQSMGEKLLFGPITFVLVVACFIVSIAKTEA